MDILDRITVLLGEREQQDLTNYLNLKKSAYTDWKAGKSESYRKYLIEIAEFFDVSIDYLVYGKEKNASLSNDQQELLDNYKKMPERGRLKLIGMAAGMAEVYEEQAENSELPTIEIRHSFYKVSAGTGYDLDGVDKWDTINIPDTVKARRADFCLTISGNSMEPIYYDGDIVLIKSQPNINNGEIGIFIIENAGYIKKFGSDRLISLNAEYDDILFSDYDPDGIRCVGLVIGRV